VSTDDLGLKTQGFRLPSLRDWMCVLGWESPTTQAIERLLIPSLNGFVLFLTLFRSLSLDLLALPNLVACHS
jgi:hypothetical protein